MATLTQTNKKWNVTFTQKDKPDNVFTATYTNEQEYLNWVALHEQGFDIEVEIEMSFLVQKGPHDNIQPVDQPDVTYSLEAFISTANDWVVIRSGIASPEAVTQLIDQLNITPENKHVKGTKFRVVRVMRDAVEELWGEMW
ncbi:hypothetical protein pEaSNUABM17_00275 [Erwinia phage pEa_SNUABM_17]|uniref:Uncharacterized protein n=1 Tax=Erwinia phage pEa_SNUABM_17 TaxID=2869545 RepID=A0AAE8C1L6_9CAUD|nr:hypothetical protein MPK72_gp275 [Erwinia phage pEa_SNUABM_17]QZE57821.1 hypothetical protein pEaSNUABM17_00275 [Erwinia phage pEa_SNUABM_17]